ncbi:hypothetical protein [Caldibacillus debilis]|uniref:hypothetical protein n=1 Tax=Caldibacillus debilis TaxID=301148 RepID=UPI0023F3DB5C|nr:hypothetical protein [Caldibacillus debilis]
MKSYETSLDHNHILDYCELLHLYCNLSRKTETKAGVFPVSCKDRKGKIPQGREPGGEKGRPASFILFALFPEALYNGLWTFSRKGKRK